jgi:preprotein translocase subunit SecD
MKTQASRRAVLLAVPIVAGILNAQSSGAPAQSCPTMEVSAVAGDSARSSRHVAASDGTVISLAGAPLLTIGDFTDANVSVTEHQVVLNVSMTDQSAQRMQAFTASHVGARLAFLANGRVINTPKILDPIKGKGFLIGPLPRDEAQRFAAAINHRERSCEAAPKEAAS